MSDRDRDRLVVVLLFWLAAAPAAEAVTAYPCAATGVGPKDCTCVDWGAHFDIRCPAITDWRELGDPPNPPPERNTNVGPGGPTGNPPGRDLDGYPILRDFFKIAKATALARGKLSAMLPKSHPDYEPTDCMELFAPYGPKSSNGKWLINQFIEFRLGEGVQSNGIAPCSGGSMPHAWSLHAGSGYPYVFLCDRFANLPLKEAAVIIIHEALHVAGLEESPATPNRPTSQEIQNQVRQTCNL